MYVPESFAGGADQAEALIREHDFATLISPGSVPLAVTHLPLLFEGSLSGRARLWGHVARANPHWRAFEHGGDVVAVFHGPHAYVSPAWYVDHPAVPTWNYAAVHVHGTARPLTDRDEVGRLLDRMIERYEGEALPRWRRELPESFLAGMVRGVVAFEIEVAGFEAKLKLGQNRSEADRRATCEAMDASRDPSARALAALTRDATGA